MFPQEDKNIAMYQAVLTNNLFAVKILVQLGASTSFVRLASRLGYFEIVKFLIHTNGLEKNYYYALCEAAISNNVEIVKLLVEYVDCVKDDLIYECKSLGFKEVYECLVTKTGGYPSRLQ